MADTPIQMTELPPLPGEVAPAQEVDMSVPAPSVPVQIAGDRARRYDRALGNNSTGVQDMSYRLTQPGGEEILRQQQATRAYSQTLADRQRLIENYISNRTPGATRQEDIDYINSLSGPELQRVVGNPQLIMEREIANRANEEISARPSQARRNAMSFESTAEQIDNNQTRVIAAREFAENLLDQLLNEQKNQTTIGYTLDQVGQILPWYKGYQMRNRLHADTLTGSSLLPGSNAREQANWYYSSPLDESTTAMASAVENLRQVSLQYAIDFTKAIVENDTGTFGWMNIGAIANVAPYVGFVPYKAITMLGTRAYRRAAEHVMESQAINRSSATTAPVIEAGGDIERAADVTARDILVRRANEAGQVDSFNKIEGLTRSVFNPPAVITEAGTTLSNEAAQRTIRQLERQGDQMSDALLSTININRMGAGSVAERTALDEAQRIAMHRQYSHLSDRMLDTTVHSGIRMDDLPPKLRKTAQAAWDAEVQLQRRGLEDSYQDYISLRQASNQAIRDLERIVGKMTTNAGEWTEMKLTKQLRDQSIKIDNIRSSEIVTRAERLAAELKAVPEADRKLFNQLLTLEGRYSRDAATIPGYGASGRLSRPSPLYERYIPESGTIDTVEGVGNVKYVRIKLGRQDATLFETGEAATTAGLNEMKLKNFRVRQQGTGYYVEIQKAVDETASAVRDAVMRDITTNQTPQPLLANAFYDFARGSDYKFTREIGADMKVAAYGASQFGDIFRNIMNSAVKDMGRWSNEGRKEWLKFLDNQRMSLDETTGVRGRFSENQFKFELEWNHMFGKSPTEAQSVAYWTYVQLNDFDYIMMNLGIYRDKVRQGLEHHYFKINGHDIETPMIEGRVLNSLAVPKKGDVVPGVLVWDRDTNNFKHFYYSGRTEKDFNALINKGYKIVQVTHVGEDAMKTLPGVEKAIDNVAKDSRIDFVLTRDLDSAPLGFQQTPYRAGGHHNYEFRWYLRQPVVKGDKYYGDKVLHGFDSKKEMDQFAKSYNTARQMVRDGADDQALASFLSKSLPQNTKEFRMMFGGKDGFSLKDEFYGTPAGKRVIDTHNISPQYPRLRDTLDDPYNLYNTVNLRNAMERGDGLTTINNIGTKEQPWYKMDPAPRMDILPTIDRSISFLTRNQYVQDLRVKAGERFIAEFGNLLDTTQELMRRDPVNAMFNIPFKPGSATNDPGLLATARNYRNAMREFMQVKSESTQIWEGQRQKIADFFYDGTNKDSKLVSVWENKRIKDPNAAVRSFAFNYHLLSPVQFVVQAAGAVHVAATQGIAKATQGALVTPLTRFAYFMGRERADILDHAANIARTAGWNPKQFKEAMEGMYDSGFAHVGREHAMVDDLADPTISAVAGSALRDAGRTFYNMARAPFRWGEETVRHNAWMTSYLTWREANPTAVFDDTAKNAVLRLADRSYGNQSAASVAPFQRTFLGSTTTGFFGYNWRIMEQMLDKQPGSLTTGQKAYAATVYGTMFGVGSVGSLYLAGAPISEWIRRWTLGDGSETIKNVTGSGVVDNENNMILNILINGVISAGIEAATGGKAKLDVAGRLGPGGNRFWSDLISDKSTLATLSGASGSAVREIWGALYPFPVYLMDHMTGTRNPMEITRQDFERVLNTQSGASQFMRMWQAIQLGKFMSSSGNMELGEIKAWEGIIFGLTGLQPQRFSDLMSIMANNKGRSEAQQSATREIDKFFRAAMKSLDEGDKSTANDYLRRVNTHIRLGGFTPREEADMFAKITRDMRPLMDRVFQRYAETGGNSQLEYYKKYLQNK